MTNLRNVWRHGTDIMNTTVIMQPGPDDSDCNHTKLDSTCNESPAVDVQKGWRQQQQQQQKAQVLIQNNIWIQNTLQALIQNDVQIWTCCCCHHTLPMWLWNDTLNSPMLEKYHFYCLLSVSHNARLSSYTFILNLEVFQDMHAHTYCKVRCAHPCQWDSALLT